MNFWQILLVIFIGFQVIIALIGFIGGIINDDDVVDAYFDRCNWLGKVFFVMYLVFFMIGRGFIQSLKYIFWK